MGRTGRPQLDKPNFKLKWRRERDAYVISYTESGKSKRVATGCSSRSEAEAFLDAFVASFEGPAEPEAKTVDAILGGYLGDREGVVKDFQRLEDLRKPLKRHLGWLPWSDIKPTTSKRYASRRRSEGAADGTIRRELGGLRAALRWAVEEQWIGFAPAVKLPPKPPSRDRWLTRDEAERLVDACTSHHLKTFVLVALHTAARKRAILELKWDQVDFLQRRVHLNPPGRRQTSKRRAVVPMNAMLLSVLEEAFQLRQTDYVIEWDGSQILDVKKAFQRTVSRAGLRDVTPHVLRHTAATWMALEGVDMRKISIFLGHDDIRTTERVYAHHHPDYLADAAEALM